MRLKSNQAGDQRGITGLETAIILIFFVVVASVFAFTVLSTGIFAWERSKETVFAGIEEAQSSIEPRGSVIAYKGVTAATSTTVFKVTFVVSNAIAGEPVDLTPDFTANGSKTHVLRWNFEQGNYRGGPIKTLSFTVVPTLQRVLSTPS